MNVFIKFKFVYILLGIFVKFINTETIVTCNFEDGFCGYSENDKFVRYTGPSPSKTSGPLADKTTGNGYYALCYGSLLFNTNDKCTLSQYLSLEKSKKFSFWYFMHGTQIGTLELHVNNTLIWSLEGSQKDEWLLAEVNIPQGDYLLQFFGTRSSSGRLSSDIAIDDIIIEGEAPINVDSRYFADCDFDQDTCDWHSDFSHFKWSHVHAIFENDTQNYGPESDFTSISSPLIGGSQNGSKCSIPYCLNEPSPRLYYYCKKPLLFPIDKNPYCGTKTTNDTCDTISSTDYTGFCKIGRFMIISSDLYNGVTDSLKAHLYSPSYKLADNQDIFCVIFRFNIWGRGNDGFRIFIQNYENKTDEKLYWELKGPLPVNKWYSGAFTVDNLNMKYFRFVIEPFRGSSRYQGSIAIDSIEFKNDTCPDTYITMTTTKLTTLSSTTRSTTTTTTNIQTTTTTEASTITSTIGIFTTDRTFSSSTVEISTTKTIQSTTSKDLSTSTLDTILTSSTGQYSNTGRTTTNKITEDLGQPEPATQKIQSNSSALYGGIFGTIGAVLFVGLAIFMFIKLKKSNKLSFFDNNSISNNEQSSNENVEKSSIEMNTAKNEDQVIEELQPRPESKKKIRFILNDNN